MKYLVAIILAFALINRDWKTFQNSDFTFKYPDDWELDQSGTAGTKFILFAPNAQPAAFRDNINLIVQDLKGQNIDLKKYTKLSVEQVKQYIANAKILTSETVEKNKKHKLVYSGNQGELSLQFQQYYLIGNEKAYILTFTATQKSFPSQIKLVDVIMESFAMN